MKRTRSTYLAVVLLQFVLTGLTWAEDDAGNAKSAPDPSGSWKWSYTFNDNTADFSVKLNWDGKQVTGKYTAFNNTSDVEEGKLENDELSYLVHREFNGNKFVARFKGKVEDDDITGTVNLDRGDGPQEFEWHAKRTLDSDDVLGVWKLKVVSPNGVIEPQITITKDESGLHNTYASPFGVREAKNLTVKDGELTWDIGGENNGMQFSVKYRGKPRGNSIAGKADFDFGGNTGTMDFTGKRTPPEDKKAAQSPPATAAPAAAEATPQ